MTRYLIIGWVVGMLYWIMDGVINGNPYAQLLYQGHKERMRKTINIPRTFFIYLIYGYIIGGIFLLLYKSLPGEIGIVKGMSFAAIAWFFRGLMPVMAQWMTFPLPTRTLVYMTTSGLGESLVLGILLGLTLKG